FGGPAAKKSSRPAAKSGAASRPAKQPAKEEEPRVAAAEDWESFQATAASLRREIEKRAAAMSQGPVGTRAVELASLRLAASGRNLVDAGSLDGALEVLQRAVSLYGGNGYAYLYLAYVHHVQGRPERAAEFAASARRHLPRDKPVQAELEGLRLSIRQGAAAGSS
ncbi:MAG: tetratricopeptide repeat protein, partial [Candidatus Binatia bacterium]